MHACEFKCVSVCVSFVCMLACDFCVYACVCFLCVCVRVSIVCMRACGFCEYACV